MRGNTITVRMVEKGAAHASGLYQYDYGQRMIIDGVELPVSYEVHFSNQEHGNSKTRIGDHTGVDIPDEYLQSGENVYVWLFLHNSVTDGETDYHAVIHVQRRAKPTDLEPTPVQQDAITQAIAALNSAVEQTAQDVIDANAAADAAQAAVDQYNDMTAEATELPSGSPPIAEIDHTGDHPVLQLGIPEGKQGPKGDPGQDADPTVLIDDLAGPGIKDKTWSVDKIAYELALKANELNPVFRGNLSFGRKDNTEIGENSSALGAQTTASGQSSVAEGIQTIASGDGSHAEGVYNIASGAQSHSEGFNNVSSGSYSHSEGYNTIANGNAMHASGIYNTEPELYSVWVPGTSYKVGDTVLIGESGCRCIIANSDDSFDLEKWELLISNTDTAFVIGNGTDSSNRSNALSVDWNGNEYLMGDVYVNSDPDSKNGSKLAKVSELADVIAVQDQEPSNPLTEIWLPETQTETVTVATLDDLKDVIDDTAGDGDTEKTWSADKLTDELNLKAPKANPEFTGSISLGRKAGTVVGNQSIAIGRNVEASRLNSRAYGSNCKASGSSSTAQGYNTIANGVSSFAEGQGTIANGSYSHALGAFNIQDANYPLWDSETEYAVGDRVMVDDTYGFCYECIVPNINVNPVADRTKWVGRQFDSDYALIIGNGTYAYSRSNAMSIDWNGTGRFAGDIYVNCNNDSTGGTKLASMDDIPDAATLEETQLIIDAWDV